jgi:hypothetical protein
MCLWGFSESWNGAGWPAVVLNHDQLASAFGIFLCISVCMPDSTHPFWIEPSLAPKLAAFDRLFETITVSSGVVEALRERFITEFPWTQSTTQIEQMLQDALGQGPWAWLWHREWRDRFESVGAFPTMWTTLSRIRPEAIRQTRSYDHRIFLLAHSLTHQGHAEQIWSHEPHSSVRMYIDKPMADEPPAIQAILREYTISYCEGNGPTQPPPFFPGDRTGPNLVLSERLASLEKIQKLGTICWRRPRP